jgi:hypothetical protein
MNIRNVSSYDKGFDDAYYGKSFNSKYSEDGDYIAGWDDGMDERDMQEEEDSFFSDVDNDE